MYDMRTIDIAVDLIKTAQEFLPLLQEPKKVTALIKGVAEANEILKKADEVTLQIQRALKLEAVNAEELERLTKITEAQNKKEQELSSITSQQSFKENELKSLISEQKSLKEDNIRLLKQAQTLDIEAKELMRKAEIAMEDAINTKAEYVGKLKALMKEEV